MAEPKLPTGLWRLERHELRLRLTIVADAIRCFRKLFLFGSLAALVLGGIMLFVPVEWYSQVRVPDDEWEMRMLWTGLILFSIPGFIVAAILYCIRLDDEPGPLIIRR